MTKLSDHFDSGEFQCNCCGRLHPSGNMPPENLLAFLEIVRTHFGGRPVNINSGYRCPAHNARVGGATHSRHLVGDAADFWISGVTPQDVYEFCDTLLSDAGGVGQYDTFTHIDVRGHRARW